jgi:hypothetical protein
MALIQRLFNDSTFPFLTKFNFMHFQLLTLVLTLLNNKRKICVSLKNVWIFIFK